MRLLLLLFTLLSPPATKCEVNAQPALSIAPLRFIKSKVIIERGTATEARLALVDEGGEVTASGLHTDYRTQWVEWKNVVLGPGIYEVVLQTNAPCRASARIEVHGNDGTR